MPFAGNVLTFVKKYQVFPSRYQKILQKYSAYYNLLPDADKYRFERRVFQFIYSKQFIPRGFSNITDEMKVLISAAAIQLTFRLPQIYLAHFNKILVYPDTYYSTINKMYHVGEVNPRMGIIILSWKSFIDGYADLTDSYNVAIHEMAHALHFENRIRNSEFDFLDEESLYILEKIAATELPKLQRGEQHFFRSYAGTNEYEFFAVSLEYFFEKPQEFKTSLPLLYETLSKLLNQDPAELYKVS
ncbi:zinc-dependent peptidase [Fulvivirga sp. 29W222]|uniref:Zinc-dependent peptidase n=1 Tax=Fulvivirga marina TaxID=2494733 RepID=A0A937KEL8_9BACT|nr:zinc-dependent peptidase [Fulvivirga marina]